MDSENGKYQIGTKENKEFLKEIRKNLLEFGRQFQRQMAALTISEMIELHGKTEIVRHGLQAVCCTYTALERCLVIKGARH